MSIIPSLPFEMWNDPCDEWPIWIEWRSVIDDRTRPIHDIMSVIEWAGTIEPPRYLGRFNCRGDYILYDDHEPR